MYVTEQDEHLKWPLRNGIWDTVILRPTRGFAQQIDSLLSLFLTRNTTRYTIIKIMSTTVCGQVSLSMIADG
jgi:hypothetical protein